jgi:hypothetical protein
MTRWLHFLLCLGWLCLPLSASAEEAEPSQEVQTEYQQLAKRAIDERDAGHFAEARRLFERAHALWPSARTLRTLGMTAFDLDMYPEALRELQAALDDPRRALEPKQREQVAALIDRTRARVGIFSLTLTPAAAQLTVDGKPADATEKLVLTLGDHELVARAPGHEELRRTLGVRARQDESLTLTLKPSPPPPSAAAALAPGIIAPPVLSPRTPAQPVDSFAVPRGIALILGALGVATSTTAGILALNKRSVVKRECENQRCSQEGLGAAAAGRTWMIASDIGTTMGVLGIGTWLLLPGGFLNGRADERGVALVLHGELL